MIYEKPVVKTSGGYVLYVELCNEISLECNKRVHALYYAIKKEVDEGRVVGIEEIVPAYASLTIFFDPRKIDPDSLRRRIEELANYVATIDLGTIFKPRKFRIPVAYGGEYGPDMQEVCRLTGLSEEEVVKIHTSKTYVCYMLGFTPGFVYLGDVDDRIAVPRLQTPRTKIPPGSVGIAGKQTGIYGVESPGGWRLIGRTPVKTFDPKRDPPTPIRPGDLVEFYSIKHEEFNRLLGKFVEEVQ